MLDRIRLKALVLGTEIDRNLPNTACSRRCGNPSGAWALFVLAEQSGEIPLFRATVMRYPSLFASLSDQELQHLASSPERRIFAKGRIIVHRGNVEIY